ncbi:hypothetical protein GCM10009731_22350 [Streptomyces globosus]
MGRNTKAPTRLRQDRDWWSWWPLEDEEKARTYGCVTYGNVSMAKPGPATRGAAVDRAYPPHPRDTPHPTRRAAPARLMRRLPRHEARTPILVSSDSAVRTGSRAAHQDGGTPRTRPGRSPRAHAGAHLPVALDHCKEPHP